MERTSFLTDAEKRAAVGYGAQGTGGGIGTLTSKYRPDQSRDDQGKWVDEAARPSTNTEDPIAGGGGTLLLPTMSPEQPADPPPSVVDCIRNKPDIARDLSAVSLIGPAGQCIASATATMGPGVFFTEGFSVLYDPRTGDVVGTSDTGYDVDAAGNITPRR